ncbi:MAG: SusC/RagA family TonB-linked outer membrane protein, partial [Bacteroidota bacterium]
SSGANFPNYREDWVGRVTYNYDTRYFLEVNGAYNGSEKFAREYRFGFFPSYAVGWLVSNENFFKNNVPFLTHLKLRYSYGTVGSDEGIDRWQYVGGYALTNRNSQFGWPNLQNNFQIYEEDIIANPDIRWETAVKQNLGIETSWLNGLISVNFDYYWDHRTNIFMSANQRNVPVFFGADPVAANLGETKTYGWELEASIRKMYANGFNFFIRANYNHAIDQIIFREDPELAPDYLKQAGFQIGQTRSQLNSGFINSWDDMYTGVLGEVNDDALPGDFRQVDFNADGVINGLDEVPFGFPSRPQYQGNFSAGVGFKNFNFNFMLVGAHNVSRIIARGEYSLEYSIVFPFHLDDS